VDSNSDANFEVGVFVNCERIGKVKLEQNEGNIPRDFRVPIVDDG
jgi:hypothetical protein